MSKTITALLGQDPVDRFELRYAMDKFDKSIAVLDESQLAVEIQSSMRLTLVKVEV